MDTSLLRELGTATDDALRDALGRAETLLTGADLDEDDAGEVISALGRRLGKKDDAKSCSAIVMLLTRVLSSPAGVGAETEITKVLGAAVALTSNPRLRSPVARLVTALVVQAGTTDTTAAVLFRHGLDSHSSAIREGTLHVLEQAIVDTADSGVRIEFGPLVRSVSARLADESDGVVDAATAVLRAVRDADPDYSAHVTSLPAALADLTRRAARPMATASARAAARRSPDRRQPGGAAVPAGSRSSSPRGARRTAVDVVADATAAANPRRRGSGLGSTAVRGGSLDTAAQRLGIGTVRLQGEGAAIVAAAPFLADEGEDDGEDGGGAGGAGHRVGASRRHAPPGALGSPGRLGRAAGSPTAMASPTAALGSARDRGRAGDPSPRGRDGRGAGGRSPPGMGQASPSSPIRSPALVRLIGAAAVDALASTGDKEEADGRAAAASALASALADADPATAAAAARPVAEALASLLADPVFRVAMKAFEAAQAAAAAMGHRLSPHLDAVLPPLRSRLADTTMLVRHAALRTFGGIMRGTGPGPVVAATLRLLQHRRSLVRDGAVRVLVMALIVGGAAADPDAIAEAAAPLLSDPNARVTADAVELLVLAAHVAAGGGTAALEGRGAAAAAPTSVPAAAASALLDTLEARAGVDRGSAPSELLARRLAAHDRPLPSLTPDGFLVMPADGRGSRNGSSSSSRAGAAPARSPGVAGGGAGAANGTGRPGQGAEYQSAPVGGWQRGVRFDDDVERGPGGRSSASPGRPAAAGAAASGADRAGVAAEPARPARVRSARVGGRKARPASVLPFEVAQPRSVSRRGTSRSARRLRADTATSSASGPGLASPTAPPVSGTGEGASGFFSEVVRADGTTRMLAGDGPPSAGSRRGGGTPMEIESASSPGSYAAPSRDGGPRGHGAVAPGGFAVLPPARSAGARRSHSARSGGDASTGATAPMGAEPSFTPDPHRTVPRRFGLDAQDDDGDAGAANGGPGGFDPERGADGSDLWGSPRLEAPPPPLSLPGLDPSGAPLDPADRPIRPMRSEEPYGRAGEPDASPIGSPEERPIRPMRNPGLAFTVAGDGGAPAGPSPLAARSGTASRASTRTSASSRARERVSPVTVTAASPPRAVHAGRRPNAPGALSVGGRRPGTGQAAPTSSAPSSTRRLARAGTADTAAASDDGTEDDASSARASSRPRAGGSVGAGHSPARSAGVPSVALETKYTEFEDLEPLRRSPAAAIARAVADLTSKDWQRELAGLDAVRRLSKHHADVLGPSVSAIARACVPAANSLRSSVSKTAIMAVGELAVALGRALDGDLDFLIPHLLRKSADTSDFIAVEAESTLHHVLGSCGSTRTLGALLHASKHKATVIRLSAARWLAELGIAMGDKLAGLRNLDDVVAAAARYVGEGKEVARHAGKRLLLVLHGAGALRSGTLERVVGDRTARNLRGVIEKLEGRGGLAALESSPSGGSTASAATGAGGVAAGRAASRRKSRAPSRASSRGGADSRASAAPRPRSGTEPIPDVAGHRPVSSEDAERPVVPRGGGGAASRGASRRGASRQRGRPGSTSRGGAPSASSTARAGSAFVPMGDELKAVLDRLGDSEWRTRLGALDALLALAERDPSSVRSNAAAAVDEAARRVGDGNIKVATAAVAAVRRLAESPALHGGALEAAVPVLFPPLATATANRQKVIASGAVDIIDRVLAAVDAKHTIAPLVSAIVSGNSTVRGVLLARLAALVGAAHKSRPGLVQRAVLPKLWPLLDDSRLDTRNGATAAVQAAAKAMGKDAVLKAASATGGRHSAAVDRALE